MNDAELAAFRDRCYRSAVRNYAIAHAASYATDLKSEAGDVEPPLGSFEGSAYHLAALAQAVMDVRAGKRKKPTMLPVPKPPPKPKPLPEPIPEPEPPPPTPEPIPEPKSKPKSGSYEKRTKRELYDLAADRDIEGRSGMGKDELVAALEDWDEKHSSDRIIPTHGGNT